MSKERLRCSGDWLSREARVDGDGRAGGVRAGPGAGVRVRRAGTLRGIY